MNISKLTYTKIIRFKHNTCYFFILMWIHVMWTLNVKVYDESIDSNKCKQTHMFIYHNTKCVFCFEQCLNVNLLTL